MSAENARVVSRGSVANIGHEDRLAPAGPSRCAAPDAVKCLREDVLWAMAEGTLGEDERADANAHLDRCPTCRAVVVGLLRGTVPTEIERECEREPESAVGEQTREAAALLAGRRWADRYLVTRVLGRGGMGVVYAAWDANLQRDVALKVIRGDSSSRDDQRAARLVRESRALARLRHPHVVTIYDVGTWDGRVYLSMELLEGGTLRRFIEQGERDPAQVLAIFCAAGEGLCAAHQVGLVHRDFKPDNVLLDHDRQPKVADFGLARDAGESTSFRESSGPIADPSRLSMEGYVEGGVEGLRTHTGVAVGTPGYMAPEQRRGEPTDARADVYAFCVALYEALHGRRPQDVGGSPRHPHPLGRRVTAVLREGLGDEPQQRPLLRALLDRLAALQPDPRRRSWPWSSGPVLGVGLAVGLGAAGLAAFRLLPTAPSASSTASSSASADPCAGARTTTAAAGRWSEPRRSQLAAAWGDDEDRRAWSSLAASIDDYVEHLDLAVVAACEEPDGPATKALPLACLELRRRALDAALELVAQADPRAAQAVDALPPVAECRQFDLLERRMPIPDDPDARAQVERIRGVVASARSLQSAGRYADAREGLEPLVERAERLGFDPLHAEVLYELGVAVSLGGEASEGEPLITRAAHLAAGARHDTLAAQAWAHLVYTASEELHDYPAARRHLDHARTAVARLGDTADGRRAGARLVYYDAILAWRHSRYDEAMTLYTRAIDAARDVDPQLEANAMDAMGILHIEQGRFEEAIAVLSETLRKRQALHGPRHPFVADSYGNLATAYYQAGDHDQALEWVRRSVALKAELLGRAHPSYGLDLHQEAQIRGELGQREAALALARRARAIFEGAREPDHIQVAIMLELEGSLLLDDEQAPAAVERLREAIQIYTQRLGDDSPQTAGARLLLAVASSEDEPAVALAEGLRSIDDYVRHLGPSHLRVINARTLVGEILLDQGQLEPAQHQLERAMDDVEPQVPVGQRGTLRFLLARALLEQDPRSEHGSELLRRAVVELEEAGAAFADARREVAQWRREQSARRR